MSARDVTNLNKLQASEINGYLTHICNERHITINQQKFLSIAIKINVEEDRPFNCYDFQSFTRTNYRQMIHRLRDFIVVAYKSNPCQYRVRGTPWKKILPTVTDRPTGERMIEILRSLREKPPKIHDIKLKISSNLHNFLPQENVDPTNKGIKMKMKLDQDSLANVLVYPKIIQVDIACTNNPIIYDISGVVRLCFLLGHLYSLLQSWANYRASIAPFYEWTVTHYHFGKDGTESFSGQSFHRTFEDFSIGLVRFYSKEMPDGKTIPRIEQVVTPNNSLNNEIDKMIFQETLTTN